jgi:Caspase domain/Domain of unknown function (DUF4407)
LFLLASKLSGLSRPLLVAIGRDADAINLISFIEIIGLLAGGFSAGYLIYFCTSSIYWALTFAILLTIFLICIQALTLSSLTMSLEQDISKLNKMKPTVSRLIIFLVIGLVLSQPIVLSIFNHVYEEQFNKLILDNALLEKENVENKNLMREDELSIEIAKMQESLNQIKLNQPADSQQQIDNNFDLRRKALVIGNQLYPSAPLNNPVKDANDLRNKLNKMGFKVTLLLNASRKDMELGLKKYLDDLKPGDISLFFFSGHGFQEKGNNYLIPVDFIDFTNSKAFSLNVAIDTLSSKSLLADVMIIDACRSFSTGVDGGLATTEAGLNTYIAFASKPGQSALDGKPGSNGIFTAAILNHIAEPVDIDSVFRSVREEVSKNTNNSQETWTSHSLSHALILTTNSLDKLKTSYSNQKVIATSVCQENSEGLSAELKQNYLVDCTSGELAKLNDDLVDLKQKNLITKKGLDESIKKSDVSPGKFLEVFYEIWMHPTSSILLTILTTLIISSGFIARFLFFDNFKPYIRKSYYESRNVIAHLKLKKDAITSAFPYDSELFGEDEKERNVVFETGEEDEVESAPAEDNISEPTRQSLLEKLTSQGRL